MSKYSVTVPCGYNPEGPYSDQLARLAAKMMLLTSILKAFPECPILTVHDEMIVPETCLEPLLGMVTNQFQKFNVKPTIKVRKFSR